MRKPTLQTPLPPMEVQPVAPTRVAPVNTVALADADEDNSLALKRRFVREAIDELHWKHDAIAALLDVTPPYLSKMLDGEKPITQRHLDRLPDDVEALYYKKCAEHHGLIVVERSTGEEATRRFVSGLFGLLAPGEKRTA